MSTPENDAIAIAQTFLRALGARDLDQAESLTADDFNMVISGGHAFDSLLSFVSHSATHQKSAAKHTDQFEALADEHGVVVYCFGTMSGAWLDDSSYQNVRFIDRFLISDGKISDMQVWSDMAEFRPADPPQQ